MSAQAFFPDFVCNNCGSPSIEIAGPLTPATSVNCGGCGRYLCDWNSFVEDSEALLEGRDRLDSRLVSGGLATFLRGSQTA